MDLSGEWSSITTTLLTTGLLCVIAAIVGGGLSAFGIKMPALESVKRQVMLGLLGVILLVSASLTIGGKEDVVVTPPPPSEEVAGTQPSGEELCANAPPLILNEICAEGSDCDGQKDFVEIYNPSASSVDLSCYLIADAEHRKPLQGELPAQEVRAWTDDDLGFGLARQEDRVSIIRNRPGGFELVDDSRSIDNDRSYQQRLPDGGEEWQEMDHDEVEADGNVGSRNGRNSRET
jgi:hypothetical protein